MAEQTERRVVIVSAGVSDPSTTRMLAERLGQAALDRIRTPHQAATASVIDLAPLATDIARALVTSADVAPVRDAIGTIATADALIVSTPVYKAGISGLLKSFLDLLDDDLILARPVILAATAGTARHALVVDEQLRSLFAFLRALPTPTSVFAAPEDWADPALGRRIERAATELAHLVHSGIGHAIAAQNWDSYQHRYGSAARARGHDSEVVGGGIDLHTDLMRLATGGRSVPAVPATQSRPAPAPEVRS